MGGCIYREVGSVYIEKGGVHVIVPILYSRVTTFLYREKTGGYGQVGRRRIYYFYKAYSN